MGTAASRPTKTTAVTTVPRDTRWELQVGDNGSNALVRLLLADQAAVAVQRTSLPKPCSAAITHVGFDSVVHARDMLVEVESERKLEAARLPILELVAREWADTAVHCRDVLKQPGTLTERRLARRAHMIFEVEMLSADVAMFA
jgi:hypothetical protein